MRLFVWTGGALFAGSLALTAWTYAVVFARVVPFPGWPDTLSAALVDTLLFSCFALHHSLFSRDQVKAQIVRIIPAPLLRSVYVWVASALLIAVDLLWRPVGGVWYRVPFPATWICIGVQMIGLWLTVRGARAIDPLDLAGIRDSTLPIELQVGGPYGVVRHPLYFGWTLVVFGTPAMTADRLVFAIVSTAYLAIAIPFEERSLIRHFGQQYERDRGQVRWRMIPFVY
jgi:protein-S-isoprenylcysteine O-methyltransferase Ste14